MEHLLEGAYFLNEWFGIGGILRYSMHPYSYTNFKSSGDAQQLGFSANIFIHKIFLNDKISITPSIGGRSFVNFVPNRYAHEDSTQRNRSPEFTRISIL